LPPSTRTRATVLSRYEPRVWPLCSTSTLARSALSRTWTSSARRVPTTSMVIPACTIVGTTGAAANSVRDSRLSSVRNMVSSPSSV
jgi:hypothetical protein